MFKNMKLSSKIFSGFFLILFFLGGISWLYNHSLNNTLNSFVNLIDIDIQIQVHTAELNVLMLESRRHEKDFLIRLDKQYLDKHIVTINNMKVVLHELKNLVKKKNYPEILRLIEDSERYAAEYCADFQKIAALWIEKGLTENDGLQGRFRDAAHKVAAAIPHHQVQDMMVTLLLIRRYEKDFSLTRSESYRQKLLTEIKTFEQRLTEGEHEQSVLKIETSAITEYKKAALEYFSHDDDSLYQKMRAEAAKIENAIETVMVPGAMEKLLEMRKNEKDYLLRQNKKYVTAALKNADEITALFANGKTLANCLRTVKEGMDEYKNSFTALYEKDGEISAANDSMRNAVHKIEPAIARIDELLAEKINVQKTGAVSEANKISVSALYTAVAACAAGIIAAFLITSSIVKPVNAIIQNLSFGSRQVNEASQQVSQTSQNLAEGANEQAASLEETSASLQQISGMIEHNTANSKNAHNIAEDAEKSSKKGIEIMRKMDDAISKIKTSSDETAKIVKTIDEIAFQTNLLALNAAVEAARAGEAGKGFAVVAEEVRNLAQRSAEAAKTTASLIQDSQKNSENGVAVSHEVGEILKIIEELSGKVRLIIAEVSSATEEQSRGIAQLNTAVVQIDKVTQNNAANAEEAASASEELSGQAVELNRVIAELSRLVSGTAAQTEFSNLSAQKNSSGSARTTPLTSSNWGKQSPANQSRLISPDQLIPFNDK